MRFRAKAGIDIATSAWGRMATKDRKAAIAAYKQRKTNAGIYAVRCLPSGQVWVGSTPNLEAMQNRIWFSLRHGNSSFPTLQSAWNEHGADDFTFEELERLDEEAAAYRQADLLKQRVAHWRASLNALPI